MPAIIFHVHNVDKSELHDGFKPPHLPSPSIPLQINKPFIFGRGIDVNLRLTDKYASKRHMELSSTLTKNKNETLEFLKFEVKNLSELKHLKVNDCNVCGAHKICLKSFDKIKIGQNSFTVEINRTEYNSKGIYTLELRLPDEIRATSV